MKRRKIVAIVFLVVVLALGIVFVVHAVGAGPVPAEPVPLKPAAAKTLPVKPAPAKPPQLKGVPGQPAPAEPLPVKPTPAEPLVPAKPVPQWDDGFVRGNEGAIVIIF
jgi:hypothetical protein